jgi:hypothetical protein
LLNWIDLASISRYYEQHRVRHDVLDPSCCSFTPPR